MMWNLFVLVFMLTSAIPYASAQLEARYLASFRFQSLYCSLSDVGFELGCTIGTVIVEDFITADGVTPTCTKEGTSKYKCTLPPLFSGGFVDSWLFFADFSCSGSSINSLSA